MLKIKIDNNYPRGLFHFLYTIEPKHFWFNGRNSIIKNFIQAIIPQPSGLKYLEIGCGTGFVLSYLEKKIGLKVTGIDINQEGLDYARKRTKALLIKGSIDDINGLNNQYDLVGLFDVLEHVDNEEFFLKTCRKFLKTNGLIFITVPADMKLYTTIDKLSGHKKRYTREELSSLINKAGFKVIKTTYFGLMLYLPLYFYRRFILRKPGLSAKKKDCYQLLMKSIAPPVGILNKFLEFTLRLESKLINKLTFSFGTSLIVAAIKI